MTIEISDKIIVLMPISKTYVAAEILDIGDNNYYIKDENGDRYPVAKWQVVR